LEPAELDEINREELWVGGSNRRTLKTSMRAMGETERERLLASKNKTAVIISQHPTGVHI